MPNDFYASCKLAWKSSGFSFTLRKRGSSSSDATRPNAVRSVVTGSREDVQLPGFTHCCGNHEEGRPSTIKRKTIAKRRRAKLLEIKQQLAVPHAYGKVSEVGSWLRSVVRGWLNYHAGCPATSTASMNFMAPRRAENVSGYVYFEDAARKDALGPGRGFSVWRGGMDTQSPNPPSLS